MKAAVAGYERKAKVEGSCGDNAVGHIGNNVAGNVRERISYAAIYGGDEQPRVWVIESRTKPLQGGKRKPSSFNQVNRFNERYRRYVYIAGIADSVFNRGAGNR